jgi:AcrR family transcriptional regulator
MREKHRKQTDRILAVARRLFAKNGAGETSMQEIARECRCTKANLYFYFESKEKILDRVFEIEWKKRADIVKVIKPGMDLESSLRAIGRVILRNLDDEENAQFIKILISEGFKHDRMHETFTRYVHGEVEDPVMGVLLQKTRARFSRKELWFRIMIFFGGILNHVMFKKIMHVPLAYEMEDEEFLDHLCRIFV